MILFLEGTTPMSESMTVKCDQCSADISNAVDDNGYRLRLIEEDRVGNKTPHIRELNSVMNFCNLGHLRKWLEHN